jgi:flagellar hook-length control protein FliK
MSLQPTPPAAPTSPVAAVAKAPQRHSGSAGHGPASGGVSPFAQLLQEADDAAPDTPSTPPSADDQHDDAEQAERPGAQRESARKPHDPADETNPAPQQQQPAPADAAPAALRAAASLGHASLLAAARSKAGAALRSERASATEQPGADHGTSLARLGAKDAQYAGAPGEAGIDISAFKPTLDATAVNLAPAEPSAAGAGADFSLPSLGQAGSAPAAPTPEAPPAQATLAPPPGSAAFPAALGAQLSTWLKDGVQYATLELNPQDMGPIDVRIALRDGRTQVELGADVPATRDALNDALPALAEALGDVGLSLAGGSVSDQTGQHARQGDAEAQRAFALPGWLAPAREGDGAQAASPQRAHRGLIDLVA